VKGILLDTHVLIWFVEGNNRLSAKARYDLDNPLNKRFVSIVSLWEVVIKASLNRLDFVKTANEVTALLEINDIKLLNISLIQLDILSTLPHHHNDPFDRLLIAQAITEDLTIISADRHFDAYPVNVSW